MHSIQIHKVIGAIISLLYMTGVWHREDKPTVKEIRTKWFYSIYYLLFVLSLAVGAITNEKWEMSIFLGEVSIAVALLTLKFWILIWKQNEILSLLNRVCVFSIRNDDDHNRFNDQTRGFIKFVFVFAIGVTLGAFLETIALSFFGSEKSLFFEIAFPLDYKDNEVAFWIAYVFLFTENVLTVIVLTFTVMIWYLLLVCSLRYEVLGSELRKMGRISERRDGKMTEAQMHKHFFEDLKASIDAHVHLVKLINDVESFFADIFFIQFGTSGLCICCSIYCLAFDIGDNLSERLVFLLVFLYLVAELFMITYFGNEIMLSSDRLTYSLFESNWYDQPQTTKKCILVFGEYLKQPQVLVIGKLYPLTLETFTRIMNSAYNMFNILKSFQE